MKRTGVRRARSTMDRCDRQRADGAVCFQPVDVPSTQLTGEITALALHVSCASRPLQRHCNVEYFATGTLQQQDNVAVVRTSCLVRFVRSCSVSCKAVDAAALCCQLHVADRCTLSVACCRLCTLSIVCCLLHVADCVHCLSSVALRGCRSGADGVGSVLFEALT